jgi:hypothetical protein
MGNITRTSFFEQRSAVRKHCNEIQALYQEFLSKLKDVKTANLGTARGKLPD